ALGLAAGSPAAHADAVADWNRIALATIEASGASPEQTLQALATVHAAMFEALNFVEPRYKPQYTGASVGQPGAPKDRGAAGAAHHILRELYPGRAEALGRELRKSLGAVDNQQAAYSAAITGKSIAQIVWAVRATRPGPAPGAAPAFGVDRQPYAIDVRRL